MSQQWLSYHHYEQPVRRKTLLKKLPLGFSHKVNIRKLGPADLFHFFMVFENI